MPLVSACPVSQLSVRFGRVGVLLVAYVGQHAHTTFHTNQLGPPHYPLCKYGSREAYVACKRSPTGVLEAFLAFFGHASTTCDATATYMVRVCFQGYGMMCVYTQCQL